MVIVPVKNSIELPHENISQDPERPFRRLNIQRHKAHLADRDIRVNNHIVNGMQVELRGTNVESNDRQRLQVGTIVADVGHPEQSDDVFGGSCDQTGAGV